MKIITTKDGSHTLFSEEFDDFYHSGNGAIQESSYVFIREGLDYAIRTFSAGERIELRIFEAGFGTGLNALLTMLTAEARHIKIDFTTIEPYPVDIATIPQLNYTQQLGFEFCYGPYHTLHLCRWDIQHAITNYFSFKKIHGSILDCPLPIAVCDLIFFDAFSPAQQPEIWTREIFEKLYDALMPGGILVTYCSKSSVQKAMREAGFVIEKLAGPPGKREMIRAHKK